MIFSVRITPTDPFVDETPYDTALDNIRAYAQREAKRVAWLNGRPAFWAILYHDLVIDPDCEQGHCTAPVVDEGIVFPEEA